MRTKKQITAELHKTLSRTEELWDRHYGFRNDQGTSATMDTQLILLYRKVRNLYKELGGTEYHILKEKVPQ
jgi:hypothetical protein